MSAAGSSCRSVLFAAGWFRRRVARVAVLALLAPVGVVATGGPVWAGPPVSGQGSAGAPAAVRAGAALTPPSPARLGQRSTPAGKPGGKPGGKPVRVRELGWKRTASSTSYAMSDGTTQVVLSPGPVRYRDGKGGWQDIDTRVVAAGDGFENVTNGFRSRFGRSTDRLARFEAGGASIGLGAAGAGRAVTPSVSGSTVTFPDVFGTADVRYRVSGSGLKEDIVLANAAEAAPEYRFEVRTAGLVVRALPGGAIGFFTRAGDAMPAYVMPAPFMSDASRANHAGEAGFSERVTQTVTQQGGRSIVTVRPDLAWLTAKARVFPVVIDPTITVVPGPADAQDTTVAEQAPTFNYDTWGSINVGNNGAADLTKNTWRGLLKFDTSVIPAGTSIRSADLNVHFASSFSGDANTVPLSAHEVLAAWNEATVTWATMPGLATLSPFNQVLVDDQDTLSTAYEGPWKDVAATGATGGTLSQAALGTAPDAFYWNPRVPGPGDYQVEARYLPAANRGTPTYLLTGETGSTSTTVNQTTGAATGAWGQLGTVRFAPDKTAQIKLIRQAGTTATQPVADSVRLTEWGRQTKASLQHDAWHSYALGTLVQKWVNTPSANFGVGLRAVDESNDPAAPPVIGGVYYQPGEDVYGGDMNYRPNLVITYGEPGVVLPAPVVIHASGPELSWSKYVDPKPVEEDNLVEYQIFRGCRTLPGGACTNPAGDYYTTANPAGLQLVATVPSDVTSWTDESAVSSTATEAATYNYWVVARTVADTQNGQDGRAASNVQTVTIPRQGRIVRVLTGDISDTTLSGNQKTTVLSRPDSTTGSTDTRYWLQVGNSHATYGDERAVLEFDTAAIKQAVKVTDARLELSESGGGGSGTATLDLHALTRDFVEGQATWNQATNTIGWTTPGGDYEATALANVSTNNDPKRLTFDTDALTGKVQAWVNNLGDNHGFLLKARDEVANQQFLNLVNSESPDTLFRPRLVVEHLEKNDAQTFEADQIPERFVPGTIVTAPVTVTNTSTTTWPSTLQLSYRWTQPDSTTDITVEGDRNYVPLGRALSPGESVTLQLPIRTPINSDTGAKRLAYDLYLDLWTGTGWFSATNPPSPNTVQPTQGCAVVTTGLLCVDRYVEDPTSNQLGLEKFLSYTGDETGGGPQLLTNLYSGNAVWSYDAISNPSLGPSTFVRLAYNSMDVTDDGAGFGVSVQPGTLTRLGSRLSVPSGGSVNNLMTFIDGDGTTHTYKLATQSASLLTYTRPAGVALALTRDLTADTAHQWVFTRPDGTRFYYSQNTGLPTFVVDRNGNTLTYVYDNKDRLTTVRDAGGRTTLTLGYDTAGLVWIRDLSGRALRFGYNPSHQLIKLEDGGPSDPVTGAFTTGAVVKTFQLGYTDTSVNSNAKLNSVKDPRNAETRIEYFTSTENSAYASWPKRYTDRRGNDTTFTYADPDGSAAKDIVATVTDVNGTTPSVTTYRMDGYGRTTGIKNANANADGKDEWTLLGWDSDHNVIRLQEPNGAVSTWEYDPVTGYPLKVRDAMAVKNSQPGIALTYETLTTGARPTVLKTKTSTAGRTDTFAYDANGNLKTVRNGLGYGPSYAYNPDGTLATGTDANNGLTKYELYDANGYPQAITDPLNNKTEITYDVRGNVMQVKDPLTRITTAEHDVYGRPFKVTTPYDGTQTRTTQTTYDQNDNVVQQTAPNGAVTGYTFDPADNATVTTLPDNNTTGRQIVSTYDPLGRLATQTAPEGVATASVADDFVTKYTYDRVGQVVKVETPFLDGSTLKTPTTTYTYDSVGNQILAVDPNKNASTATDYTIKTVYDLNHRVTAIIDAAGYTSKNEYDPDGLLTAQIDALGNKRRTVYDAAGQPIEVHVPHTPTGGATQDRITKASYDPVGNVTRTTRPSGLYDETVYNANNQPIQTKSAFAAGDATYGTPSSAFFTYDAAGQLEKQSEPTFGTAGTQWTNFTYYGSGEIKTSTDPWQITASYEYNPIGQQTTRTLNAATDDATRTQRWGYYPDGAPASRSDSAAQQPVDVLDNADGWQTAITGTWATVTGGTNTQGADYRTHAAAAAGTPEASDTFSWKVTPDLTGTFDVYASCPVRTDTTTAATYTIGTAAATVDQKACTASNPWIKLGNWTFTGGATTTVVLKPSPTGVVAADAVKLVATSPPPARTFTYSYDRNGLQTQVTDTTPGAGIDTYATTYDKLGRAQTVQELKASVEKRRTDYTYDLNSNPLTSYASRPADTGNLAASRYTAYTWDVRNLVDTVRSGATPTSTLDTWDYTYDPRAMRATVTKPNGNVTTVRYHEDGLVRSTVERTSGANGSQMVSSHALKYNLDGDRSEDVEKVDRAGSTAALDFLDQISTYTYTPSRKLKAVTKTGAEKGDNETYVYDAAGNITSQTIGATSSTMTYDRNRLTRTVTTTGGVSTTMNHRYDTFGRATTIDVGAQVIERNSYDGYDRLISQQNWTTTGVLQSSKTTSYDPFDRTSSQSVQVGTQTAVNTRFTYLGLEDQIAVEEQTNTPGTWKVSKAYTYGPGGEKLALVDTPVNGTTTKKHYYGFNPHGDVETLTDATTGQTTSTYRYTAYGNPDKTGTTGDDAITGDPAADADVVNPYRFNAKRFDGATGTIDMGFRDYDPGLNRFLTRDMYNGALNDMALGHDPWTGNRYAFAGGNPISLVENDGHVPFPLPYPEAVPVTAAAGPIGLVAAAAVALVWWAASSAINAEPTADEKADAAGVYGTEEGAEQAAELAENLNDKRRTWLADNGTTAVVKVWDSETNAYKIKVAVSQPDKNETEVMPEGWEEKIRQVYGNEIEIEYVKNQQRSGVHAEEAIIDSLGDTQVIVEGGANRSVCSYICNAELGPRIELGGESLPNSQGTRFRAFWRASNSDPYGFHGQPIGGGDWGMTP